MVQWETPENFTDVALSELKLREKWNLTLFAIKKGGGGKGFRWGKDQESLEFNPSPDYTLEKGDVLVLIGKSKDLTRFTKQK